MEPRLIDGDSPSGMDITLLGLIAVIVGGYGRSLSVPAGTAPDLIRFFSVPPERTYPAVMPQDKALLLLNDPSIARSRQTTAETAVSLDGVWTLVALVGVMLVIAGPVLVWLDRD
ncbi:hypothetical protein [Haloplanus halobius]|uniref:hypothetical protein n=1 Tax=Haloplanus halobius TaxID=2934938 RepID=UPI00200C432B|nr:hypothetical protein [Haloplanus sp. XH21]